MDKKIIIFLLGSFIVLIGGYLTYNYLETSSESQVMTKKPEKKSDTEIPEEIKAKGSNNDLSQRTELRKTGAYYYNGKKIADSDANEGQVYFLEEDFVRVTGYIKDINYQERTIQVNLNTDPGCEKNLKGKLVKQVGMVCGTKTFEVPKTAEIEIFKTYLNEGEEAMIEASLTNFEVGDFIDLDLSLEQLSKDGQPIVQRIQGAK